MNSRKCDVSNIDVQRASYAKHLRSKKHLQNEKQNRMITPEMLFKEPIESRIKKLYNPKPLTQLTRDKIKKDDKQLNKGLAKKMINLYYYICRNLKVRFKITLESHHINHAISNLNITSNYPEFGIEVCYKNEIIKDLSVIYARLIDQYFFENQTVLSARLDKQDEGNQVLDETELFFNLNNNHSLTESYLDNIGIKSPLENQIREQEMKDSGWRFHKVNSMTIYF